MIDWHELKKLRLLADLTQPELEKLAAVMEQRTVAKGAIMLHADDPGQFLVFVLAGRFKVELVGHDGRQVTLDVLKDGDFFGEMALLTNTRRSADVEALEDSTVLVLSGQDFEGHVLHHPGLTLALARELAVRLRATSEKVGELVLLDVYRRLARVLWSLGEDAAGEGGAAMRVIRERPTHRDLAALSGTSREMVTRALKELEAAGHIEIEGKEVRLLSLPR